MFILSVSCAMADDLQTNNTNTSETGIHIGVLTFIGTDLRIYHREPNSRLLLGIRYINFEEDFINEAIVGLPNEPSDRMRTSRTGVYTDYLLNDDYYNSFFASIAILQTAKELECNYETSASSATGLYFGGGYRGNFSNHFGYTIGMLISPFVNIDMRTATCESNDDGDFDLHFGITYKF